VSGFRSAWRWPRRPPLGPATNVPVPPSDVVSVSWPLSIAHVVTWRAHARRASRRTRPGTRRACSVPARRSGRRGRSARTSRPTALQSARAANVPSFTK
jgi:hypothetical protein